MIYATLMHIRSGTWNITESKGTLSGSSTSMPEARPFLSANTTSLLDPSAHNTRSPTQQLTVGTVVPDILSILSPSHTLHIAAARSISRNKKRLQLILLMRQGMEDTVWSQSHLVQTWLSGIIPGVHEIYFGVTVSRHRVGLSRIKCGGSDDYVKSVRIITSLMLFILENLLELTMAYHNLADYNNPMN